MGQILFGKFFRFRDYGFIFTPSSLGISNLFILLVSYICFVLRFEQNPHLTPKFFKISIVLREYEFNGCDMVVGLIPVISVIWL